MDDTGGIFGLLAKHMAWLGQRQSLAAKNIANSGTSGFVPMGHYCHPLVFEAISRP
jgi:flagellar basal body rod protein FlgB